MDPISLIFSQFGLKMARTHFGTLAANFGINKGPTNNQTSCLMVHLNLTMAEHFLSSYWLIGEVLVSGWTYLPINMPLLGNVFSQSKATSLIVQQEYTLKGNLYIAMNCYLFDVQMNFCDTHENSQFDLVEFGPLNMIYPHTRILSRIARTLQGISLLNVPKTGGQNFLLGVTFLLEQELFYQFTGWYNIL